MNRRAAVGGLAALALASPALARTPARRLFNGRDLAGWTPVGDANWTVAAGAVSADRGGMSFLVSAESFADFDLTVEAWVSDEANSGVFIRCSDRTTITAANAYEINIFDRRPDPTYATGAIVDVAAVASPHPRAGGRWNRLQIGAHGDRLSVSFNGRRTVNAVQNAAHARGPIALQYGSGAVRFRRVEIRPA